MSGSMKPMQWHVKGVHPNARDSAREAARRAGMSVGEWLNSVILDTAEDAEQDSYDYEEYSPPLQPRGRYPEPRGRDYDRRERDYYRERDYERRYEPRQSRDAIADEVAAIHGRLESLTEGVENLMRSTSMSRGGSSDHDVISRRLADAISRLDQRVEGLVNEGRNANRQMERRVESVDRALSALSRSRSISSASWTPGIDQTVAEIAMRQRELDTDGRFTRQRAPAYDPHVREELARHDFDRVDDRLRYISEQIDTLGPGRVSDAISALRNDLAEIARTLSEASPRRAIEALEGEVRVLASRLDSRNRAGTSTPALATLERGLGEVRDALRGLTPAENLAGAVDAIHALSQKIDQIASGRQDPAAMQQLETAIAGLRSIASHAASSEAVTALTAEVRALADRIDSGAASQNNDTLKTLESRIGMIADAIEQVRASGGHSSSPDIDQMVRSLGDKIDKMQGTRGDESGLGQLDARITNLVQKLEASESKLGRLDAIERGMKELLGYIAELRGGNAPPAATVAPATAKDVRRTEQSLEAVHDTIGDVVDRLAMIETGIRAKDPDRPAAPVSAPAAQPVPARPAAQAQPAPAPAPAPQPQRTAIPAAAVTHSQPAASYSMEAAPRPEMPRAAPMQAPQPAPPPPQPRVAAAQQIRPAADGSLPYDFPLEPGSGKPRPGMAIPANGGGSSPSVSAFRTPAERIATSKASLETSTAAAADDGPKSNFIEAARRAAQFAAETQAKPGSPDFKHAPEVEPAPVSAMSRIRKNAKSVLVGASVLILIAAGIHFAVNFLGLNGPEPEPVAPKPQSSLLAPDSLAKLTPQANTIASGAAGELQTRDPYSIAGDDTVRAPQAVAQMSQPPQVPAPKTIQVPERIAAAAPVAGLPAPEVTGAVPTKLTPPPAGLFNSTMPRAATLPPSIGSRTLITAAEGGDAAAAFEVAVRYSEGRGVTVNLEEAAAWFERSARGGLTPAIFRLGGLYEKGIGVRKDLKRAHALYLTAANRGSAKAMHNLAVLYAEGIDAKPDYPNALVWFRKAADRGVADSQFNLGVLYARGIGMEANMAESYRWFSLAAQGGDRDAAQKRDDVAKRLDPQTLKAVQASVQSWRPEPQPDDAVSVRGPAGGWDQAAPQTPAKGKTTGKRAQADGAKAL